MEYTSEHSVIKASGTNGIKNPFGSTAYEGWKAIILDNVRSTKFWLPILFFALILILFSSLYVFTMPKFQSGIISEDFSITFITILIIYFAMLTIFSVLITPFIFNRSNEFDERISNQIPASSYWGLITGKYLGVITLYQIFVFISSLMIFTTLLGMTVGSNFLYVLGKSLQIYVFGIIFTLTWATLFTSFGVFFHHYWQSSTFLIGLMFALMAFIPIQSSTVIEKNTTTNVVMDQSGNVIVKELELTTFTNLNNKSSAYKYIAPFDLFAWTTSMFTLFDGTFNNQYVVTSKIEEAFNLPQKQVTKNLYQNKHDYKTMYSTLSNSNADLFGNESQILNENLIIVDYDTYRIGELIKEKYTANVVDKKFKNAIINLSTIAEAQYTTTGIAYEEYLNDNNGSDKGNYTSGDDVPAELLSGKYLDISEYLVATHQDTTTLEDETENKIIIEKSLGFSSGEIKDWNYVKSMAIDLTEGDVTKKISPLPNISPDEAQLRASSHNLGYTGTMNTTQYKVNSKPFLQEWHYILIGIGTTSLLFFAAAGVIMMRNYH